MRLDELRPTRHAEDRRGGGLGIGILGLLVAIAVAYFLGVDPQQILNQIGADQPPAQTQSDARADDPRYQFARKIIGSAEDIWAPILKAKGVAFTPATLTVYDFATETGCGTGVSVAGPFYCPQDGHIYLDLTFFNRLSDDFGAPGEFAQAYVVAHEYGHHIQALLGKVQLGAPSQGADSQSVRTELQADCYAGVWANRANARFKILQSGDVASGLRAAAAVGDDMIEKRTQGTAVPDSFTHGTSAERVRWFKRGLASGDMDDCDTFSAENL